MPATIQPVESIELVDLARVARSFDVSEITVRRWEAAGILPPAIRTGPRLLRWHKLTLENWVNSGRMEQAK